MVEATDKSALEALERATTGQALTNYPAIFEGFTAKGIAVEDIKPRENVFTFQAWKALGRAVKKGEHGVKVHTVVEKEDRGVDEAGDQFVTKNKWGKTTTVFHITQTELESERQARKELEKNSAPE